LQAHLGSTSPPKSPYCGGEFVAVTSEKIADLNEKILAVYLFLMSIHSDDKAFAFEEAHVLSMAYALLGWGVGDANRYIKRIWTQPLMHRNAAAVDLRLLLIHVPAEKKYGVRRIYNSFFQGGDSTKYLSLSNSEHRNLISNKLGIPTNSPKKWIFDVAYAFFHKVFGQKRT
jgi:hypothetical protein